jgi:hypothetical protein
MSEHLSDLALDAIRLGRGDRSHLDTCAICQARAAILESEAAKFATLDHAALIDDALARPKVQPIDRRSLLVPLALAAAASLLYVALPSEGLRPKGAGAKASLHVLVDGGPAAIRGPLGDGDRLALQLAPPSPSLVRILWWSAPDGWRPLYPEQMELAWHIAEPTWLDREVVLDGASGTEAAGVVFCRDPVTHTEARTMLEGAPREDCTIERIEVQKR